MGDPEVIVIGVGVMGAATCRALARRGVSVVGLERYDVPHGLGSSGGGHSRLIRLAYHEHADYVPLLRESYRAWNALEEETGRRLMEITGAVFAGRPEGPLLAGIAEAVALHGLECPLLDPKDLAQKCPPLQLPGTLQAVWEPEAGLLHAELAVASLAESAMAAGAEIRARETVVGWEADDGGVVVTTDRTRYEASRLILTAGPWTASLVGDLGVDLAVTRQATGWVWPKKPDAFKLGRMPCWAIEHDREDFTGIYYGFPMLPGRPGMKVGLHRPGDVVDPDHVERAFTAADDARYRPALEKFMPEANGPLLSGGVCLYTSTPDHHFILDRLPSESRVTIGCGFSGHGFKFAPVVGEALAELALDGGSSHPVDFLSLARFRP